jgi:hypothetical protein
MSPREPTAHLGRGSFWSSSPIAISPAGTGEFMIAISMEDLVA